MVIFTRRRKESVLIGEHIKVTVLGVKNGHVRFGITAPASVAVDREEIYRRKQAEAEDALRESRT